jgi:hypothetical protein
LGPQANKMMRCRCEIESERERERVCVCVRVRARVCGRGDVAPLAAIGVISAVLDADSRVESGREEGEGGGGGRRGREEGGSC